MKKQKKFLWMALMMCVVFVTCSRTDNKVSRVKIAVLMADATSSEAIAFKAYYSDYIQKNYNVEFLFSEELGDASAEKTAIENFITNNCKGIISMASADRPSQIQQCEDAGVYYAVATGTLTEEQYNTYKNYKYYVGAIGPDLGTEYQTGFDMAKYYMDKGTTKFAIFGGGVPYRIEMHVFRTAGMLAALCTDSSTSYGGQKNMGAIIGKLMTDGTVKLNDFKSDKFKITAYHELWNFDDAAWQSSMAALVASNPEVLMAAGTGFAVFGAQISGKNIKIADIDSFTKENGDAMKAGILDYLAGKFNSINGPIFIALLNALNGNAIRGEGDTALALSQGYWVATSATQFNEYMTADTTATPVYNKAVLDAFLGGSVSYNSFKEFVGNYKFEDFK
jgi:hypothetical protein